MSSIRLVVFDLDGTLIDSIGDIAASANRALVESYGEGAALPQDTVRTFVGGGARQLIERCLSAAGKTPGDLAAVFERFMAIYRSRLTETTHLYPGMKDALDELERGGLRLAILTNKPGDMSRVIVRDLGLEGRFVPNIGGDDLKTKKPDPEGLLKILSELGCRPEEAAMVGDSAIDIRTAKNAGTLSVGVTWGYDRAGMEAEKPDLIVDAVKDLARITALAPASP
jgi:phosphoglycolate phosphatase